MIYKPIEPTDDTETTEELEAPAWDVSKFDEATWPEEEK